MDVICLDTEMQKAEPIVGRARQRATDRAERHGAAKRGDFGARPERHVHRAARVVRRPGPVHDGPSTRRRFPAGAVATATPSANELELPHLEYGTIIIASVSRQSHLLSGQCRPIGGERRRTFDTEDRRTLRAYEATGAVADAASRGAARARRTRRCSGFVTFKLARWERCSRRAPPSSEPPAFRYAPRPAANLPSGSCSPSHRPSPPPTQAHSIAAASAP